MAHRYYLSHLSEDENRRLFGACARPHGHGHDYVLDASFTGEIDPSTGMVVNIVEIKRLLGEALEPFDGAYVTADDPLMNGRIPSTEALVRVLWDRLEEAAKAQNLPATVHHLRLSEYRRLWAECARGTHNEESPVVTLTRTYEFAAAHRLNADGLSDTENRELFGKCNNLHGHGHNYLLEVTVGGEPDPTTGFLIDLPLLDKTVNREVVDRYDHRHLNLDLDEFRALNPTSENLVKVVWERLANALPAGALRRVAIHETERNLFVYEGDPA